jgi:glucose-1-phosphatase
MPIQAVVFDFGGVLMRTQDYSGRIKWEEKLNLRPGELEKIVFNSETAVQATLGSVPEEDIWKYVGSFLKLSAQELIELRQDFWSGDNLDLELVDFLRSLRPRYQTAILSNAWSGARQMFTHQYSLHTVVNMLIISAEESLAKPDLQIYRLSAERLGVLPSQILFVDDVAANIEAAQKAGWVGIQFHSTSQVLKDIQTLLAAN